MRQSAEMENRERVLQHYRKKDGEIPFQTWFFGLKDKTVAAKVLNRLDMLKAGGFGKHRALGGGLVELKIDYGPGYRVYLGIAGRVLVILLTGGDKSTQQEDIEKAKEFWDKYREAKKEEKDEKHS